MKYCLRRYNLVIVITNIQQQMDAYKIESFNTPSWIEEVLMRLHALLSSH